MGRGTGAARGTRKALPHPRRTRPRPSARLCPPAFPLRPPRPPLPETFAPCSPVSQPSVLQDSLSSATQRSSHREARNPERSGSPWLARRAKPAGRCRLGACVGMWGVQWGGGAVCVPTRRPGRAGSRGCAVPSEAQLDTLAPHRAWGHGQKWPQAPDPPQRPSGLTHEQAVTTVRSHQPPSLSTASA